VKTLKSRSSNLSKLVDCAESLRKEGRLLEALEAVEHCLQKSPGHPRSLLLHCRILYLAGRYAQALHVLDSLEGKLGKGEGLKKITEGLESLWQKPNPEIDPAFITETMADLHIRQGYLWEAMEIYRQLYRSSEGKEPLWQKILDLRDRLGQEESQKKKEERDAERWEALTRWIKNQQRGS